MQTPRNEIGLTTAQVKLPPIRLDRAALDALCATARTAIENASNGETGKPDATVKPRVLFSATFTRGGWRNRETVRIDETDIDHVTEPVRTTNWSVSASDDPLTANERSIRMHAFEGRALLKVTSRDAAWRRAAIASVLEVAAAHAPRHRWRHHWITRTGTGVVVAIATVAGSLITPTGLGAAVDAGLAAFCGVVLGGWATAIHTMVSNRRSHVLVLEPNEQDDDHA